MATYDGGSSPANTLGADLGSNLYEMRNRILESANKIRIEVYRLRCKNEQLMSSSTTEKARVSDGRDSAVVQVRPLLAGMNDAILELEAELDHLGFQVNITETI